jgi:hypothetical protein
MWVHDRVRIPDVPSHNIAANAHENGSSRALLWRKTTATAMTGEQTNRKPSRLQL